MIDGGFPWAAPENERQWARLSIWRELAHYSSQAQTHDHAAANIAWIVRRLHWDQHGVDVADSFSFNLRVGDVLERDQGDGRDLMEWAEALLGALVPLAQP